VIDLNELAMGKIHYHQIKLRLFSGLEPKSFGQIDLTTILQTVLQKICNAYQPDEGFFAVNPFAK